MGSMKKLFVLVLLIALLTTKSIPVFAIANVIGKVQLVAKPRSFPERLLDIFLGNSTRLPTEKKPKNIIVVSNYDESQSLIRLDEVGSFSPADKQYFFFVPVPILMGVHTNKASKVIKKEGVIRALFTRLSELNGDNHNDNGASVVKAIKESNLKNANMKNKKLFGIESVGEAISILSLVASRRGNKGTIKGTFASKKNRALGRFNFRFDYQ
jgi:hypothetical protein